MSGNVKAAKTVELLLVEDVPAEAELTMDTLSQGRIDNLRMHWVEDGAQAMAFLRREGRYADAPRPDLILLDLHVPRMGGLEVLAQLKQDPILKRIPVVIMTSSNEEKDVHAAYSRHANWYVTKPIDFDEYVETVRGIEDFWFSVGQLAGS